MTDNLLALFEQQQPLFLFTVGTLSLLVGSFLNVVIYRLPMMMQRGWRRECREFLELEAAPETTRFDLIMPRSRCPHCGHLIGALENIPVVSYLLQRGRCRHCSKPISARYPLIELLTALLSIAVAWRFGVSIQTVMALLLTWSLIALTFIDIDHTLLPDSIVLPVLWLGLLISMQPVFVDSHTSLIGAASGYLSLWSIYHLFKLLTGKEGMGYGDFKLLALLGAWLGWQLLPLTILLSSLVGAVIGITLILARGHDRNIPIPFGPYLAIAGWIAMMWGESITRLYLQFSAIP